MSIEMKVLAVVVAPLLAQGTLAFAPSSTHQPTVSTATALRAEKKNALAEAAAAASTCLVGLSLLSAQAALASGDDAVTLQQPHQTFSASLSSSVYLADIEQFTLPSYDSSKGSNLIDISGDVATVNKKTLQQAKERREMKDKSAEKIAADELRRAEKDGGSLLESMIGDADRQKREAIDAEIAESRANRWKTF